MGRGKNLVKLPALEERREGEEEEGRKEATRTEQRGSERRKK